MQYFSRKTSVIRAILCVQIIVLALGAANAQANEPGPAYSFVYIGDIHFDKRSHHDFGWVKANKPNDIRQIEDYVRITENHTPGLLRRIQTAIESSDGRIKNDCPGMNKKNIIDLAISIVLPVLAYPITGEKKSWEKKASALQERG